MLAHLSLSQGIVAIAVHPGLEPSGSALRGGGNFMQFFCTKGGRKGRERDISLFSSGKNLSPSEIPAPY